MALYTALAIAAAVGTVAGSPMPLASVEERPRSSLRRMMSICGTSKAPGLVLLGLAFYDLAGLAVEAALLEQGIGDALNHAAVDLAARASD